MRTLLTGQQVTSALCPVNRAFFFLAGDYFEQTESTRSIRALEVMQIDTDTSECDHRSGQN
jgi:hypothetical protein